MGRSVLPAAGLGRDRASCCSATSSPTR
jgi:hypothetical protein